MGIQISANRVSIIIPCYNGSRFIKETIESCINQTYQNIEIIVIDDGSTDNSANIVKQIIDDRIKYYYQTNQGLSAARNTGIIKSTGQFIMFLDADDTVLADKIERQVEWLNMHPDFDLVACNYLRSDAQGKILHQVGQTHGELLLKDFLSRNPIAVHTAMIRKRGIPKHLFFDTTLKSAEDWDFWIRMLLSGSKFYRLPQALVTYRILENAMTSNVPRLVEMIVKVHEKTFVNPKFPSELLEKKDKILSLILAAGSARCFVQGHYEAGNTFLRQFLAISPYSSAINHTLVSRKIADMLNHLSIPNINSKIDEIDNYIDLKRPLKHEIFTQYYLIYSKNYSHFLSFFLRTPLTAVIAVKNTFIFKKLSMQDSL